MDDTGFYEFESSRMAARANGPDAARYVPQQVSAQEPLRSDPAAASADELYAENAALARSGENAVAKFAMMDLAAYQGRLTRAVRENDAEAVAKITGEIDGFVDEHYDALAEWTAVSRQGRRGEMVAARLAAVLDGSYKDTWGVVSPDGGSMARTARSVLDDDSPEARARKASRVSREQAVGSDVAAAIVDRDSAMYPVFSRFSDLATPVSAGSPPPPADPNRMTRETKTMFLRGVSALASGKGVGDGGFSDWHDMAGFVSAFDSLVNKGGAYAGDGVLGKVADGYLSGEHGLTAHDYVARYAALVDRLSDQASGGQTAKGVSSAERRMARHEANAIASAFVSKAPTLGPEWASALESAASTVRMAHDMFGVTALGGTGYADKVASAALVSMNVPGVDDGGLYRKVTDAASDLSTLVSAPTRKLMSTLADGKGQARVGTMQDPYPYANIEMFAVKALGRAVSALSGGVDGAVPSGNSWGALKQFAVGNASARLGLKQAVADALDTRFGDREVSFRIADGVVDRFLGRSDDGRTIEERLRGYTGLFDPVTDQPEIPDAVRFGANTPEAKFNGAMAAMARNPSAVIPTLRGDRELSSALSEFARETIDRTAQGKDVYSSHQWNKMLGNLVDKAGASDSVGIVKAGWLTDFSRKGKTKNFGDKDIQFLEKAITQLAENVSARPDASVNDAILLAVLARGSGWKGFIDAYGSSYSGHRLYGAGGPGRRVGGDEYSRRLSGLVDSALAKVGVGKHVSLGTALATLSADPSYASAPLVALGLVTKGDAPLDYKNFLAKLQQNAFADVYTDKKDDPTPLQEAARRIYRSFGTRDSTVAHWTSEVLKHRRAEGLRDEELVRAETLVTGTLAGLYANGGPVAVEREARKMLDRRYRYYPVYDPKTGTLSAGAVFRSEGPQTDAEYREETERINAERQRAGWDPFDPETFRVTDENGLSVWNHNNRMRETVFLKSAGTQQEQ